MADEDDIIVACTTLIVASLSAVTLLATRKSKRKHSTWVTKYLRDTGNAEIVGNTPPS